MSESDLIWTIGGGLCLVGVTYWIQILLRMKGLARYKLRSVLLAAIAYVAATALAVESGVKQDHAIAFGFAVGLAAPAFIQRPKQSRRISKALRDAVIARDLKGERFDPKKHHIHHVVPFSRGGDNSLSNLTVVDADFNRRRGAELPRLAEMGGSGRVALLVVVALLLWYLVGR